MHVQAMDQGSCQQDLQLRPRRGARAELWLPEPGAAEARVHTCPQVHRISPQEACGQEEACPQVHLCRGEAQEVQAGMDATAAGEEGEVMLILTTHERMRLSAYCEEQARANRELAAQMEKLGSVPEEARRRYRNLSLAYALVAADLTAVEVETIDG